MAVSTALDAVRLGSSEVAALYLGSDSVWTANAPGMVLVSPTSITHSGTSATLGANGQVTFTAVTSLSLNGVFSADFDTYFISIRTVGSSSDNNFDMRLRASGSDNSTASSYTSQRISAGSTTITAGRNTTTAFAPFFQMSDTARSGLSFHLYGPFLAQPTAGRVVHVSGYLSAYIQEMAFTHNQSTSYDGLTILRQDATQSMSGAVQVYGIRS